MTADAARRYWVRVLPTLPTVERATGTGPAGRRRYERPLADPAGRIGAVTRGDPLLLHTLVTAAVTVCLAADRGVRRMVVGVPALVPGDPVVLPVPVDVTPDTTGRAHLGAVRGAVLAAYAAQGFDPRQLLDPAPDGRHPLVGWLVRHDGLHTAVPVGTAFDGVVELTGGRLTFDVDAGLFGEAAATYLTDSVVAVLHALVDDPDATVSPPVRVPPVAHGDPLPPPVDVTTLLTHPAGPAVVDGTGVIGGAELLARSAAVGRGLLVAAGGGAVALCTGQCATTVVAALAALRAGVPYVVVPPQVADDHALLAARGVTLRVVGTAPADGRGLTIDELARLGAAADAPELPVTVDPAAAAYHVYTSGTTGAAKTVVVGRGNLAASVAARHVVYGTAPQDFLLLSPLYFDSAVAGLYGTLTTGGTLHVVPVGMLADPAALAGYAREHAVTATLGLPRVLEGLLRAAGRLPDLRLVVAAGEAFPAGLATLVAEATDGARVVNEYGPSETTVWITSHEVTGTPAGEVPIGRPVPGSRVYVLDGWGRPVPAGVPGELAVGGPQVSSGYLAAPELTARRFVPDPLDPAARMYRTGDLGRADPDGTLHFLGRCDDEVKVRGARVALPDVAATLRGSARLRDAEVIVDRGELVAVGVPADGDTTAPAAILAELGDRLTGPARPSRLVLVPALPRLANGKADQAALLRAVRPAAGPPARAPRDGLEQRLLDLFAQVLDADGVGVDDNFFAAGGDSIKAALVVAELSRELSTYVYVVALLDHPTPAGLAAFLREHYRDALAGGPTAPPHGAGATEAAAATLRRLVAVGDRAGVVTGPVEPPVSGLAFVLAPPRSGTTLLRIMLGGHPGVFAPPELELLQFGTLADRRSALSGRYAFYQEGLARAVMALRGVDADAAGAWLDRVTDDGWRPPDLYRWLVDNAGGRLVVDKTAAYALDPAALRNAELWCDRPRYIHLRRHPQACVRSFLDARLDQIYLRAEHPFTAAQAAELVWRTAHEHIATFLDQVGPERVLTVWFEELVAEPEREIRRVCGFLGLPYDPAMLDVYGDATARMTDGVREGGRMLGDVRFTEHHRIDPGVASRWQAAELLAAHPRTTAVARELGYHDRDLLRDGPLLATQRWLVLMELLRPGTTANVIPVPLAGRGSVDVEALRRAVRTVARRHHPLCSLITTVAGAPVSRLEPGLVPPLTVESLPAADHPARVHQLGEEPFDLATQVPLRVHLLRDGAAEFTLLLVIHHVIADPWSIRLVVGDLLTAYASWRDGREPDLPPVPRQAVDVAAEEAARPAPDLAAARARARARLAGAVWSLRLPPVRPEVTAEPAAVELTIDARTTAGLRAFAASRGSSTYRALLAAFGWTLRGWTGDDDFCVGTPVFNRGPDEEHTVGLFVTTGVVRLAVAGAGSYDALVERTGPAVRGALADADLPYEEIVLVAASGSAGPAPQSLLSTYFSVNRLDLPLDRCPDLALRRMPLPPREVKFDVSLVVLDEADEFVVRAGLTARRFDPGAARRFAADFADQVARMVDDPTAAPAPPASRRLDGAISRYAVGGFDDSSALADVGLESLSILRIVADLAPDPDQEIWPERLAGVRTVGDLKVWLRDLMEVRSGMRS